MGNFVLQDLIDQGPCMRTVSLPRGRQTLHTMPTSSGYEIRRSGNYDWDGRKRGQTPLPCCNIASPDRATSVTKTATMW